jgi:hypothetical protein
MPTQMPPGPPANRSKNDHGSDSGKEVRGTFRARGRIANIAMILPYDATPSRMEFSERTSGGGAINAPAHRGSAGAAVHRQQKRRVDLHVVDTAADQLVEGFGA